MASGKMIHVPEHANALPSNAEHAKTRTKQNSPIENSPMRLNGWERRNSQNSQSTGDGFHGSVGTIALSARS
jgi:hypothetical protein